MPESGPASRPITWLNSWTMSPVFAVIEAMTVLMVPMASSRPQKVPRRPRKISRLRR